MAIRQYSNNVVWQYGSKAVKQYGYMLYCSIAVRQ